METTIAAKDPSGLIVHLTRHFEAPEWFPETHDIAQVLQDKDIHHQLIQGRHIWYTLGNEQLNAYFDHGHLVLKNRHDKHFYLLDDTHLQ